MALWQYGGIYMDAKMAFNSPTNDWIDFNNDSNFDDNTELVLESLNNLFLK